MANIHRRHLFQDIAIIIVSVAVALFLARSSLLGALFSHISGHYILASFVAGIFFTSSFTTAPAVVVLAKLCAVFSPIEVAIVGAFGALIGDLILYWFIKDRFAEDITYVLSKSKMRKMAHILDYHSVRWFVAGVGAIIIASPLPDELGLALMGVSRIPVWKFCVLSYVFNLLGIIVIAFVVRSVVV